MVTWASLDPLSARLCRAQVCGQPLVAVRSLTLPARPHKPPSRGAALGHSQHTSARRSIGALAVCTHTHAWCSIGALAVCMAVWLIQVISRPDGLITRSGPAAPETPDHRTLIPKAGGDAHSAASWRPRRGQWGVHSVRRRLRDESESEGGECNGVGSDMTAQDSRI
jgi:hypothetical protein